MDGICMTLKAARINKGLTQKEAAKLLGISEDTLSNYERAKCFPDVQIISRIEDLYGLPYDRIIFCPENTVKP